MEKLAILGTMAGLGLTAGVRLYATVLAVGLGLRLGILQLSPGLQHLEVLASPWVLVPAGAAYAIEFVADKIPWLDSLWDSFHTFIRPVGAALLGFTAMGGKMDPALATGVAVLCGSIAFTGHSTKAGARLLVNHSPEPFSNIGVSLIEDVLAIFGAWLAVQHPVAALVVAAVFVALFLWLAPKLIRLTRALLAALSAALFKPVAALPGSIAEHARQRLGWKSAPPCLRAIAAKGVTGLNGAVGYLCFPASGPVFLARRWGFRLHAIDPAAVEGAELRRGFLVDRLSLKVAGKPARFDLLRTRADARALLWTAFGRVEENWPAQTSPEFPALSGGTDRSA